MIGMRNKETAVRINEGINNKPIPNPCDAMDKLGYAYTYRKGLVDKTSHYTRVEEDSIEYVGEKYIISFNLASRCVVISAKEDNADFYGGKPTMFLDNDLLKCINEIREKLGWND